MEREALYARVDARVERMLERGLVQEVRGLLARGYGWSLPAMSSLGYIQLRGYIEGTASLAECVALVQRETRRFIRQQYNWFRLNDPRIHWFEADQDASDLAAQALALIEERYGVERGPSPN
jgi:tRNA dimethylallyltransferase